MQPESLILTGAILVNLTFVVLLRVRPQVVAAVGGRVVAFVGLFLLPVFVFAFSTTHHLEQSKTTTFCLSCHVMEPYGRSLKIDSADHLPASHAQNNRVPPDQACYTCHTTYAMFGDVQAKLNGMKHMYVNYFGTIPETLTLYQEFQNRECLHCHDGARNFEEQAFHADMHEEFDRGDVSCRDCHSVAHDVASLDDLPLWPEPTR